MTVCGMEGKTMEVAVPKTGDTADPWFYVWIAVVGAILAGLLVKVKYQQKRK